MSKTANGRQRFGARTTADEVVEGLDLSKRTLVVTGANTGIGDPTARALAGAGARVIYACRTVTGGEAAVAGITIYGRADRIDRLPGGACHDAGRS